MNKLIRTLSTTIIFVIILVKMCIPCFAEDAYSLKRAKKKAAEKAVEVAMYNRASAYLNGTSGFTQNDAAACYWYKKSAAKKYLPSMFMYAKCLYYGIGTEEDWVAAWNLAIKATNKDFAPAYWLLARVVADGHYPNENNIYLSYLAIAANGGYPEAQYELACMLIQGNSQLKVTQNIAKGIEWLEKAAANNSPYAQYFLGWIYENGAYDREINIAKAVNNYKTAAKAGNGHALAALGVCYLLGNGVSVDLEEGRRLLMQAAELGEVDAHARLGDIYLYGIGVEEDNTQAFSYYKVAAENNDEYSLCQLAWMHGNGVGTIKSHSQMYQCYKKAAELEYLPALHGMGICKLYGYGTAEDKSAAFGFFRKAAEGGHAEAMYYLAYCYKEGIGSPKSITNYLINLKKSAENGCVSAMTGLGSEYYSGKNIETTDKGKALEWLIKASDEGDFLAKFWLGWIYYEDAEYKDNVQAFFYLDQAHGNSDYEYQEESTKGYICHKLAVLYRYGRGVEKNEDTAKLFDEEAARYGEENAQSISSKDPFDAALRNNRTSR